MTETSENDSISDLDELYRKYNTDPDSGLTTAEAKIRLAKFGPNALSVAKRSGFLSVLLREVREPMILILVVIGIVYSLIGSPTDAITILVIILIVVVIEAYNINRARKSIDALKSLTAPTAIALRDGLASQIGSRSVVPGDILLINAGQKIPADGRLTDSYNLKVDESSLTGESFPVSKDYNELGEMSGEISKKLVFSGSLVVNGTGRMIVTGTGRNTEIGKITGLVESVEDEETPLEKSMSRLSIYLAIGAIALSVIIPLIGFFERQPIDDMIITGLSLAFATLPEELPIVISVTLAIGAYALSKKNAIVRDLKSAETLGNVTVIATDKTGTLTENSMEVSHTYSNLQLRDGAELPYKELMDAALLGTGQLRPQSDNPETYMDPIEAATLSFAEKIGHPLNKLREEYGMIEEFGFDSNSKTASYIYGQGGNTSIYVTGAPEIVLDLSISISESGRVRVLTPSDRAAILMTVETLAESGERTIAVAYRTRVDPEMEKAHLESDLIFVGLFSFIDPPRREVREAVEKCQAAGIRVIMVTGDHPKTARQIADRVGINHSSRVVTGSELAKMSEAELVNALREASIFARISPEDKYRIVKALNSRGETVAVTGDGVNDAPALKTADIGISMGIRGTDAAREAADMVLADDNFATIVDAVREGRNIFYTLRKSVKYYLTVKFSLLLIFLVPLFLSVPFPFSPIQIIVVELFVDVAALSGFVTERNEADIIGMKSKHRSEKFMDMPMVRGIGLGSLGLTVSISLMYLYIYLGTGNLVEAQTAAFSTWVLCQVFLAQNLRTQDVPLLRRGFFSNRIIVAWGVGVVAALVTITLVPELQFILSTASLTAKDWFLILLASLISTFWMEIVKVIRFAGKKKEKVSNISDSL